MNDEPALLAAIAAHPDEDTPRLAYADWLDEHGDAAARIRAEFIRVQCETYKLDRLPSADIQKHIAVYRRQHEISEGHRRDLLGSLADEPVHPNDVVFHRGFLSELTLDAGVFLRHADTIAGYKPLPRVTVTGAGRNLVSPPGDFHHSELVACCQIQSPSRPHPFILTSSAVVRIFDRELRWPRLVSLDLEACRIGGGLQILARVGPANLPVLEELDVSGNEISDEGVRLLVESPLWPGLRRLVLGGNPITDVGAETLAAAAATSRLENLNLRYTEITLDGVRVLSAAYGGRADVF